MSCVDVTVVTSLFCFLFTLYYRNTNVIKLSQPTFLALMPLGCAGMGLSILSTVGPPTLFTCRTEQLWINLTGTLTFTAFLWKIHRAWMVAKAIRHMKKIRFTNSDMYKYIFCVVSVQTVFQVVIMLLQRKEPSVRYKCTYGDGEENEKDDNAAGSFDCTDLTEYYGCFPNDSVTQAELAASEAAMCLSYALWGFLVAFGLLLCYRTKSFSAHYAESTALLLTIFLVFLCLMGGERKAGTTLARC